MRYLTCPNHPGRIIEHHPCQVCGYEQKTRREQEGWRVDASEPVTEPIERPGQLDFEGQAQLELEVRV